MLDAPLSESVLSQSVGDAGISAGTSNVMRRRRRQWTGHRVLANFPRCPVCGSYDVQRHAENFKVWFSCRRCGKIFTC